MHVVGPQPAVSVLYVDDDAEARGLLSRLLREQGFTVWEASSGAEALALAVRGPDIVVLDVVLPDLSGLEVCRRLKQDPRTAQLPVLMLSGLAVRPEDRVHGLEGGADGYLTKPVDWEELAAQIRATLRVRRAEVALWRSERLLRLVLESLPLGVCLTDPAGALVMENEASLQIWGTARDRALATPRTWWHETGTPISPAEWGLLLAGVSTRVRRDLIDVEGPTGKRRTVRHAAVPIQEGGRAAGVVLVSEDVTDQLQLEAQFRQAQKMEAVGQLAGGVAHDFNNLLTVIVSYAELALGALPAGDPVRELVGEVNAAAERATGLTRQLLTFSRKQVLSPTVIDLNDVVADMEKMLRRIIGEDIALVTALAPGLRPVKADRAQLEQVVLNLVVNARDAMPQGGTLVIATASRPPWVLLAVRDTGHGMTPDVQAHLFEPFFTTKQPGKGTGLGLATVYGIAKQSGGDVEVESAPGKGTTFTICLPPAGDAVTRPGKSHAGLLPSVRGHETILLVEDDASVRAMTRQTLEGLGYAVLEAADGETALGRCAARREVIHLLITDVVMPGLSGLQLVERLLQLHPEMKVLYLSGYIGDAVIGRGVLEEDVHFLAKPFTPKVLARAVREALESGPG